MIESGCEAIVRKRMAINRDPELAVEAPYAKKNRSGKVAKCPARGATGTGREGRVISTLPNKPLPPICIR
ncbi:hypothetical protein SAMN05421736_101672 [Evansella caseinilytica]|uniref:Uncharacterized protein n=1 Tax=Evansella caseinilytica TaxID=1503961 RepID=A0A1H3I072_9BACI|nr:hypothetical protein SAMN05421736_101672 [Evansella caseinilytica]